MSSMLLPRRAKTALISGASTGIGEETAKLLASKGWLVYAGVRKQSDADRLSSYGNNVKPLVLDVTKENQIKAAIDVIQESGDPGGIDVLINNAGLCYIGPMEFIKLEDVYSQFDVNFFGVLRLTQAALPLIRMGRPGRVINIGSVGSDQKFQFAGAYAATKSAMVTFNESLRRELAKWKIKVVVVKPGPVRTNFEGTVLSIHERSMKEIPPGSDYEKFYRCDLAYLPTAAEAFKKNYVSPRIVADRIYQAVTVRNPRNVYYDTWGSYLTCMLLRSLPVCCVDSLAASIMFAKKRDGE